jgi:hypothetical protein
VNGAVAELPKRWTPMREHAEQRRLIESTARIDVLECGRRSGKSELLKRLGVLEALRMGPIWAAKGWVWTAKYCAPTHNQACSIYWDDLLALTKPWHAREPNITDRRIYLIGGAEIWVCGLDKPQRIEGSPVDRLVVDELADVKDGAWDRHLYPALGTAGRPGRAWLAGVPRPGGQFARLAKKAKDPTEPEYAYHTWTSEKIVDRSTWEAAKRNTDPVLFAQEWLGQRVGTEGRAYYSFATEHNCRTLAYDPRLPLLFSFDFNVAPGVAVVSQEQALAGVSIYTCDRCRSVDVGLAGTPCKFCGSLLPLATSTCVVGEVFIPNGSNTPAVCARLSASWSHHKGPVICFGDASGGAKRTSGVEGSDWDLIRAYLGRDFPQATYDVDRANPPQRARVNAVNLRACNAAGERRFFIDPQKAPNLLRDVEEQLVLKGGSGELDAESDKTLGHAADAVGYLIHKLYPADFGPGVTETAA